MSTPTKLYANADAACDVLAEIPSGELVETMSELDGYGEWRLVRSPVEQNIDVMSDKPLEFLDGWVQCSALELAEHQIGDKVTVRFEVGSHPVLDLLKKVPPWKGAPLPPWMAACVAEMATGKIGGVVKNGRFLVQRPAGAVPERVATSSELVVLPKDRWRQTAKAGVVGLAISLVFGTILHARSWLRGERSDIGRMAWPQLVGWAVLSTVAVVPFTVGPCYMFTNSPGSTALVVAWISQLFYFDLFGD